MEPGRREVVRQQIQPELLKELRSKPKDEAAAWLLGIHASGHQPIAKGQPPLTRKITDSFVDLLCFMLSEAMTQKMEAPAQLHDEMAKFLAEGYTKLSAEKQAQFARMPLIWAAFQAAWPELTDEEKAPYREQFTAMFKPYLDNMKQAAAAAEAEAQAQAQAQTQAAAKPQSGGKGSTNTWQQASVIMDAQQRSWQIMQNVLQSQINTGRIIAANMGNSYTYQYHY